MLGGNAQRQQAETAEVGEVLERETGLAVVANGALGDHRSHGTYSIDQFVAIYRHGMILDARSTDVNTVDKYH